MARTEENILYWDQTARSQRERVAAWLNDRIHDMSAEEEQIAEAARMPLLAILRGLARHAAEYSADVTSDFNAGFSVGYKEGRKRAREEADRLAALTVTGEPPDEITASVVEGEPVILAGLVKGGEYATNDGWAMVPPGAVCVDASGRFVSRSLVAFRNAKERGALPITWHVYPGSDSRPQCKTAGFMLVVDCHEPFRAKSTTCVKLNSTTWPSAMAEAEGHIACMRQCYHDVESARVLFVAEESCVPVARNEAP